MLWWLGWPGLKLGSSRPWQVCGVASLYNPQEWDSWFCFSRRNKVACWTVYQLCVQQLFPLALVVFPEIWVTIQLCRVHPCFLHGEPCSVWGGLFLDLKCRCPTFPENCPWLIGWLYIPFSLHHPTLVEGSTFVFQQLFDLSNLARSQEKTSKYTLLRRFLRVAASQLTKA